MSKFIENAERIAAKEQEKIDYRHEQLRKEFEREIDFGRKEGTVRVEDSSDIAFLRETYEIDGWYFRNTGYSNEIAYRFNKPYTMGDCIWCYIIDNRVGFGICTTLITAILIVILCAVLS